MKYSKENQIEDLKYVISEFKRKGLTILAKAKEKELENLLKEEKEMLKIISNNINKDIAYVLEDRTYLFCEDWNGEIYRNGVKNSVNTNCEYKPVYKYQIENIDISKLEENSHEWFDAIKIVGFEVI